MKILLLSCGTGGGHDSAAHAISDKLKEFNIESQIIDSIRLSNQKFSNTVNQTYINMVVKRPNLFKKVYHLGELYSKLKIKSPVYGINKLFANNLEKYIIDNNYDLVICTHLFPCETLTTIKKRNPNIHFIAVATDYVSIPFWEETNPDYFVIPSKDLYQDFMKKGISKDKLLPFGIPVSPKNEHKFTKLEARRQLSLPINKQIILIMTGSMGFGKNNETINLIKENFHNAYIVVICGTNKKMKETLDKTYRDGKVITIPFTNSINIYMDACDVILTKPGGLSSTETAVKNIPTIFTDPIAGCETHNAKFYEERHMAFCVNNNNHLIEYLNILLSDQKVVEEMKRNQNKYINKKAAEDICKFAIKYYEKKRNS